MRKRHFGNGNNFVLDTYFRDVDTLLRYEHEGHVDLAIQMGAARTKMRELLFLDAAKVSYHWVHTWSERVGHAPTEISLIMEYDKDLVFRDVAVDYFRKSVRKVCRAHDNLPDYMLRNGKVYPAEVRPRVEKMLQYAGEIPLKWEAEERFVQKAIADPRLSASVQGALRGTQGQYLIARNDLIGSNLRLVATIAKRFQYHGLELEDLIQEGNIGLIKAAERFDYTKGYVFSTYADWWVRNKIKRAISNHGRLVRLPVHMIEDVYKVNKVERQLLQELGRSPTAEEIVDKANIKLKQVRLVLSLPCRYPLSLHDHIAGEESRTWEEVLTTENQPEVGQSMDEDTLKKEMWRLLGTLKPISQRIMRSRFEFDGEMKTLQEIASQEGYSRERIRQLQNKSLEELGSPRNARRVQALH